MEPRIRTIVVGAPTVTEKDAGVAAAADLARRTGATLHVVHAFDLPNPIQAAYARELYLDGPVLERYAGELRARMETALRGTVAGCVAEFHARAGAAAECIGRVATEVDAALVVVGASRGSRIWQQFLGTTAEGVIRHAPCPVLVLRRPPTAPLQRVLLTTDLSPGSEAVQREGVALVQRLFDGEPPVYRCLLVVQADTMPFEFRAEVVERLGERELETFILRAHADGGPPVEPRVRLGNGADEILAEAAEWQADLLVVGTHGGGAGRRSLLGSVAGATLRASAANVLVLPLPAPRTVPRRARRWAAASA
jgi:nucleotide-binding universal stress UspA family protein